MKFTARILGGVMLGAASVLVCAPAQADRIRHPTVVFAGLDKITGRIITFDVAINETVQFGTIQITPRVCYTRPATEAPLTTGFVEVDEVEANNRMKRIFAGWMFAASPGLHAVEHPVYDVWLTDCRGGKDIIPSPPETADSLPSQPATPPSQRQRQQARPATAAEPAQPSRDSAPPLRGAIEVGPAPGNRTPAPQPAAPAPQFIEGPFGGQPQPTRPQQPQQTQQRPPDRLPSAREAPIMMPPGSIPGSR